MRARLLWSRCISGPFISASCALHVRAVCEQTLQTTLVCAFNRGGESGDLYVFIRVKEHPELRRDGTTIHSDVEIPYVDAILGELQNTLVML